jgi:hypothetical protein
MGIAKATSHDAERVALMPMGFCYPGTGSLGHVPACDLCAALWHGRQPAGMPHAPGRAACASRLPRRPSGGGGHRGCVQPHDLSARAAATPPPFAPPHDLAGAQFLVLAGCAADFEGSSEGSAGGMSKLEPGASGSKGTRTAASGCRKRKRTNQQPAHRQVVKFHPKLSTRSRPRPSAHAKTGK